MKERKLSEMSNTELLALHELCDKRMAYLSRKMTLTGKRSDDYDKCLAMIDLIGAETQSRIDQLENDYK